jgi:hypothetical protein
MMSTLFDTMDVLRAKMDEVISTLLVEMPVQAITGIPLDISEDPGE